MKATLQHRPRDSHDQGNTAGVLIDKDAFLAALKVIDNQSGATVTSNTIAGGFTVKGNAGAVVDKPNEVEGQSKIQ